MPGFDFDFLLKHLLNCCRGVRLRCPVRPHDSLWCMSALQASCTRMRAFLRRSLRCWRHGNGRQMTVTAPGLYLQCSIHAIITFVCAWHRDLPRIG